MKLHVIYEKDGTIASIHTGAVSGPHAAVSIAGIKPGPDQAIHSIEASDEMKSLSLIEIHRQFTVQVVEEGIRLVRGSAKNY